jgi:DNA-binding protein H-NS
MKDIHEVLRRKQAKYAQLSKQIEALQQAAEKLREVAPLLAENEEDDNVVLAEMDDDTQSQASAKASAASASSSGGAGKSGRGVAPRWP